MYIYFHNQIITSFTSHVLTLKNIIQEILSDHELYTAVQSCRSDLVYFEFVFSCELQTSIKNIIFQRQFQDPVHLHAII